MILKPILMGLLILGFDDRSVAAPSGPPTRVLIVGTVHLGNPGTDLVNPEIKDVLGERRQKELREVVDRLKAFRPTKIALESMPEAAAMQQRLDQFLAGTYVLKPDERDQIGLRLAKEAKHSKVYGIDYLMDLDFDGMFGYASKHNQSKLVQEMMSEFESKMQAKLAADYLEKHTILEILREANAAETDAMGHRIYLAALHIGKGKDYPGADLVARWYSRNLHIATNIARLRENPGERILVLVGAGHGKLLRDFLREMPGFELVDCSEYLK
jgi:hypothetical protein